MRRRSNNVLHLTLPVTALCKAGLVFPERDVPALAAALKTLRDDPARARAMGQIGRRQAEERYNWTRVAERMREIYATVLADGRNRGQPTSAAR